MNIVILYTFSMHNTICYPYKLYKGLKEQGHNVKVVTLHKSEGDVLSIKRPAWIVKQKMELKVLVGYYRYIRKCSSYVIPDRWNFSLVRAKEIQQLVGFRPDTVIATWTKYAFNTKLLYELQQRTGALIAYMPMDMAPYTGGCHYSEGCERYMLGCGMCPLINSTNPKDTTYHDMQYKKNYIDKMDCMVLAGTAELYEHVRKSLLFRGRDIVKVLLGTDPAQYHPERKAVARKKLAIADHENVIFCGATNLSSKRKGMTFFCEALICLEKMLDAETIRRTKVVFAGAKTLDIQSSFEFVFTGYITNPKELADVYCAPDVFACPSLYDSGPFMINESMMSGVPVVSFGGGVSKDLIINYETGYMAEFKNTADFAKGLQYFLSLSVQEKRERAIACRKIAEEKLSMQKQFETITAELKRHIQAASEPEAVEEERCVKQPIN